MTGETFFTEALDSIPKDINIKVDLSMRISDKIAAALSAQGLTQKDFAKMMGKNEAEVSRWLSGMHNFTLATIAKISAALETPLVEV